MQNIFRTIGANAFVMRNADGTFWVLGHDSSKPDTNGNPQLPNAWLKISGDETQPSTWKVLQGTKIANPQDPANFNPANVTGRRGGLYEGATVDSMGNVSAAQQNVAVQRAAAARASGLTGDAVGQANNASQYPMVPADSTAMDTTSAGGLGGILSGLGIQIDADDLAWIGAKFAIYFSPLPPEPVLVAADGTTPLPPSAQAGAMLVTEQNFQLYDRKENLITFLGTAGEMLLKQGSLSGRMLKLRHLEPLIEAGITWAQPVAAPVDPAVASATVVETDAFNFNMTALSAARFNTAARSKRVELIEAAGVAIRKIFPNA